MYNVSKIFDLCVILFQRQFQEAKVIY